jgi:hypothetical protein
MVGDFALFQPVDLDTQGAERPATVELEFLVEE